MPVVRVDNKGEEVNLKKCSRRVAIVSTAMVAAGVFKFFAGDPASGLMVMVLGTAVSSIWNLADD